MASLASLARVSMSVVFGQPATGVRALPNVGQILFGLQTIRGGRLFMSTHNVVLINPDGSRQPPFECPDDVNIVEQASKNGIKLRSMCYNGTCYTCAGKVIKGKVDQSKASTLSDDQKEDGYVLTCVAKPLSDVEIEIDKEAELID